MSDATVPERPIEAGDGTRIASSSALSAADDARRAAADRGPCLCLSGGGFRATLFHLGALIRLNELGVLAGIKIVSSVSGGSILNGVLATRWNKLTLSKDGVFDNFDVVVSAVRDYCSRDLRTGLLIRSRFNPAYALTLIHDLGAVPARALAKAYGDLMMNASLKDLPAPSTQAPRFIFCATNVGTGACWHFHGGPAARMGDFYTGYFDAGDVAVAEAVAASSSFPPGFGGLSLTPSGAPARIDPWGRDRDETRKAGRLVTPKACQPVMLTDGGVYDNLGVEPVWDTCRTLVVSDAGHPFTTAATSWQALVPRLKRAADIAAEQVGAVRKRWMIERIKLAQRFERIRPLINDPALLPDEPSVRSGTIWAIDTPPENFPTIPQYHYGKAACALLANVRTDLNAFNEDEQMFLINHGYWLADAGIRQHAGELARRLDAPFRWPGPDWAPGGPRSESTLQSSGQRRILHDLGRWILRRDHR